MIIPIYKIALVREGGIEASYASQAVVRSSDIHRLFVNHFAIGELDREYFWSVFLNVKQRIVGINLVSMGSLQATIVHPREVFKGAILSNAVSVILVHNHPSGVPTPSKDDLELTEHLVSAGATLDIPVLDHVIVTEGDFYSFRDKNADILLAKPT